MLTVLTHSQMLTRYFATVTIILTAATICGCTICNLEIGNETKNEPVEKPESLEQRKQDGEATKRRRLFKPQSRWRPVLSVDNAMLSSE